MSTAVLEPPAIATPPEPSPLALLRRRANAILREEVASKHPDFIGRAKAQLVADIRSSQRLTSAEEAALEYAADQLIEEAKRHMRVAYKAGDEDAALPGAREAREGGYLNGGPGGGNRLVSEAGAWYREYILVTSVRLADAKAEDLEAQIEEHQRGIVGNAARKAWMEALLRAYRKRCAKGDKALGEVVAADEAERMRRKAGAE